MPHLRSAAVAVIALLAGSGAVRAQDQQEQMKKNLEEKLEKSFLKNAAWILDFDEAKAAAKKSGKLIFAYFTRSYAN